MTPEEQRQYFEERGWTVRPGTDSASSPVDVPAPLPDTDWFTTTFLPSLRAMIREELHTVQQEH